MQPKILNRPSSIIPIGMSALMIAVILWHFVRFGLVHQTDEGTAAHIFQILMPLQIPVIGCFAVRWLPVDPRWAAKVLTIQLLLFAGIIGVVFFFLDR
ncbi:MAG: hypothetical protein JO314_05275 [Acidobacteria bacterium]|nr:hypothetical protein [Acidobacteriota bacterium]